MSIEARKVLKKYWGYDNFRACQEEIIDSILAGHDTLGLMPTGGGKSITFQVPALMMPGITIVVTPLISLMKDQVDNLRARHIKAIALHSGLTFRETSVAENHIENGAIKILYVSPEKLQGDKFKSMMRRLDISLLVVDEAHCISQWGYDFRPSYLNISEARKECPSTPVLALTASATEAVVSDIMTRLQFKSVDNVFKLSFSRHNISYLVRYTESKETKLLDILSKTAGTSIVYVRSRKRTTQLAEILMKAGISAEGYHAGLAPEVKTERQNRWKDNTTRVIVATNAFGMGIDKPDVRLVIHHDIPPSLEEYYQEAGRAGRDGLESLAVMLVSKSDKGILTRRLADSFPPRDYIRSIYDKACVYLNIAMGEGYMTLHEFNFKLFCERNKLQAAQAHSAIGLIADSGYMVYQEDYNSRSRVMIVMSRDNLYNLRLSREADLVLRTLLRSYTGLFADYEYISESVIASRTALTDQQVYESLLLLSRMSVIHYIPRTNNPMMLLTASRQEGKHIIIPKTVYEDRREVMRHRLEAIKNFAYSLDSCRVKAMLQYFGEKEATDCGKCDYCRAKKRNASRSELSTLESVKFVLSLNSTITVNQLINDSGRPPVEVIETLRRLSDQGSIDITGDTITLK